MVHAILSSPLHGPELRGTLKALVTKGTHLVCRSTKVTLSIAVVITVVTIATAGVAAVTPIVATILGLTATKGTLGPIAEPSITVSVPVATAPIVASPTPRIPIPTVILVATSSPPSTTWTRKRQKKKKKINEGRGRVHHSNSITVLETLPSNTSYKFITQL